MIQVAKDTYRFHLTQKQYDRIRRLGWLFFVGLVVCAIVSVMGGWLLWHTYTHTFTLYLKWQDALVALLWFIALITLGGSALVIRFLYALHEGYAKGMVTFAGKNSITVRDLSAENLKSIFWLMNSSFWCFVAVLIGLVPAILIGWTLQIPDPMLEFVCTMLAVLLSIAGLVVSIVAATFIVIAFVGATSLCQRLGSSHTYELNGQATIRIDNFVLAIIYPAMLESMVDLNLLAIEDQKQLLSLLHQRWVDAEQVWNPELGEEIAQALEAAEQGYVYI
ncbi:MAG TPA: hypothetical protein VL461_12000 [Dictyobacter sp.]|jgi:hypothetical protein|nr:hypothetical protein [Dictyobacter sp.]